MERERKEEWDGLTPTVQEWNVARKCIYEMNSGGLHTNYMATYMVDFERSIRPVLESLSVLGGQ